MRFDRKHRHLYVNPAVEEKAQIPASEFIGKTHTELGFPDNLVKLWDEAIDQVFQTGRPNRVEFQLPTGAWTDWLLFPEFAPDGTVRAVITADRDITRRKELEEELIQARKLESLAKLAGGIAHDFNNMLTTILGNISYVRMETDQGTELYEALADSEAACRRAQRLTQQLVTFASGGRPIKKPIAPAALIREAAGFALSGSNVRCAFRIASDLKTIKADPDQFYQVIANLLLNADQSMPGGGEVVVEAENVSLKENEVSELPPGRYVKITVSDRGEGISKENLEKIFDPYFTTRKTGSGLGLSTVFSIVKNHAGAITVDSTVGEGTAVEVYFPVIAAGALPDEEEKSIIRGRGRILVMDDEPSVCRLVRRMLNNLGYEVATAANGQEAIEKYRKAKKKEESFAAVILDLTVKGGLGGKKTIAELKKIDPEIRAIVSSGYSDDAIMADYEKAGFSGVIPKPYQTAELSWVLAGVLGIEEGDRK